MHTRINRKKTQTNVNKNRLSNGTYYHPCRRREPQFPMYFFGDATIFAWLGIWSAEQHNRHVRLICNCDNAILDGCDLYGRMNKQLWLICFLVNIEWHSSGDCDEVRTKSSTNTGLWSCNWVQ